jgi:hypothetical protein
LNPNRTDEPANAGEKCVPLHKRLGQFLWRDRNVNKTISSLVFFGILGVAIVIVLPEPRALPFVLMFPLGLCAFLRHNEPSVLSRALMVVMAVASYGIYIALFIAFLRARTWKTLGALSLVLVGVLLLNIAGCKQMLEEFGSHLQ